MNRYFTIRSIFLLVGFLASFQMLSQSSKQFYKLYEHTDHNEAFDVVQTSDSGYAYVGLATIGAVWEVVVTKLDCNGSVQWAHSFGQSTTGNNIAHSIIEHSSGDLIFASNIATSNFDMLMGRLDMAGNTVWLKTLGGSRNDRVSSIIETSDGNLAFAGSTGSWGTDVSGSTTYVDVYIGKLDASNGNLLWSKIHGNAASVDEAYAIAEDANQDLVVTGRYIHNATFYTFILKLDDLGNQIFFKGYGQLNHRTYGWDLIVTSSNEYVVCGSTTIAKVNHTSTPDAFFFKTNSTGDTAWTKIFVPIIGNDRSESGWTVVEQDRGGFAIAMPTMSFTTFSQGFVPNKHAVIITDNNGSINQVKIYNRGSSHYGGLRKAIDGGYVLVGFSTFFQTSFTPLIAKMDSNFVVGCNETDVTPALAAYRFPWDVGNVSSTQNTGGATVNYTIKKVFTYTNEDVQCGPPPFNTSFTFNNGCVGTPIQFSGSASSRTTGYHWSFGVPGATSTAQNPTHTYLSPGNYTVKFWVTDECSSDTVTQTITIGAAIMINTDTTICLGDSVLVGGAYQKTPGFFNDTVFTANCDSIYRTQVIVSSGGTGTNPQSICQGDSVLLPGGGYAKTAGTFIDTIGSGMCDSIVQTVVSVRTINVNLDSSRNEFCQMNNGALFTTPSGGVAPYTYAWDNGGGASEDPGNLAVGSYNVTVTDNSGCKGYGSFTINGSLGLLASASATGTSCTGASNGRIDVQVQNGTLPYQYSLDSASWQLLPSFSGLGSGVYTIYVVDALGCTARTSAVIGSASPITFDAVVEGPPCPNNADGKVTVINIQGSFGPFTYSIDSISFNSDSVFYPLAPGSYRIYVRDAQGCTKGKTVSVPLAPAGLQVQAEKDTTIKRGQMVNLRAVVSGGLVQQIYWTPAEGLSCDSCSLPTATPLVTTTYTLTVIDGNGCVYTEFVTLIVEDGDGVYVPNVFTPNSDGSNDVFNVGVGQDVTQIVSMEIFDRWGGLQFKQENIDPRLPEAGWNGRVNGEGKMVGDGVYVYHILLEFIDGSQTWYKGSLTVLK